MGFDARVFLESLYTEPVTVASNLDGRSAESFTPEDSTASVWARRAAALLATVSDDDRRGDFREVFEHRAGVAEFDGCQSRTEAERLAYAELQAAMRAAGEISDLT